MLSVQSIRNEITNIVCLQIGDSGINLNMLLQKIKAPTTGIMYVRDVYQHTTFSTKPSPCCTMGSNEPACYMYIYNSYQKIYAYLCTQENPIVYM